MTGIISTLVFFFMILAVYYIVPVKYRWLLLLGASFVFYAAADWRMLGLIGGSIAFSCLAALQIEKQTEKAAKKGWLAASVSVLTAVLFVFKYFDFFMESVNGVLKIAGLGSLSFAWKLMVPLGISYYTFKIISYLADVYQGKMAAEKHFGYYALYVGFFPQILCGPIQRPEHFLLQLRTGCRYEEPLFTEGMGRMILGLFKKLVIADRLAGYVGTVFSDPGSYPALASIMAAGFYSIQIYCDFSGYSDIAIGMAQMFGIRTKDNFSYPYFSRSIKEFWKRWHISLSSWLRDYIYIPLGGNRCGKIRAKINGMLTFLISGLWHGSSWNFVFWGGLHGLWNMISTPKSEDASVLRKIRQTLVTFCGVTFTWIFFRAETLEKAFFMIRHAVLDFRISVGEITASLLPFTGDNTCAAHFLIVCILIFFLAVFEWRRTNGKKTSFGWLGVMLAATLLLGKFGNSSFLYGQF